MCETFQRLFFRRCLGLFPFVVSLHDRMWTRSEKDQGITLLQRVLKIRHSNMVRTRPKRTQAEQIPPAPDVAEEVAGLRGQIAAQAEESRQLRELLTQLIQGQQVGGAPPPQAVPAQAAQSEQPAERVEPQEPVRGEMGHREMIPREPLYVKFKRMVPPEFDGLTDPLEAEEWLASIQTVFEFMKLTDREK
ncbi:uncharacterized protein LOC112092625 isoform X2 [Morus notabilis]|uniref:uncharacterized protein LOC112092625 isoform X2 n=1 Tax=Morus notabilis TaxID=981085 RepID=UPI000CED1B74|nr:uncharacterized protein LOC112092625 isoform X2 [Morus notabilis]